MLGLIRWPCSARRVLAIVVVIGASPTPDGQLIARGGQLGAAVIEPGEPPRPAAIGFDWNGPLLRLVPEGAAAVLMLHDLADHRRAWLDSTPARRLAQTEVMRDWLDSEEGRQFEQARGALRAVFGLELGDLIDAVVGRDAVLALRLTRPDQPEGLILTRVNPNDRDLVERLIEGLHPSVRFVDRPVVTSRGATTIRTRLGIDAHTFLNSAEAGLGEDGTAILVWSNLVEPIEEVIRAVDAVLANEAGIPPRFASVEDLVHLGRDWPARPPLALVVSPERLGMSFPTDSADPVEAWLSRVWGAAAWVGLALSWESDDGLQEVLRLRWAEQHRVEKLPDSLRRFASSPTNPPVEPNQVERLLEHAPAEAVAVWLAQGDWGALADVLLEVVGPLPASRRQAFWVAFEGLAGGRRPPRELLSSLQPSWLMWASVDWPKPGDHAPTGPAAVAEIAPPSPKLTWGNWRLALSLTAADQAAALAWENLGRTLLALRKLDDSEDHLLLTVESDPTAPGQIAPPVRSVTGLRRRVGTPWSLVWERSDRVLRLTYAPHATFKPTDSLSPLVASTNRSRWAALKDRDAPEAGTILMIDVARLASWVRACEPTLLDWLGGLEDRPAAELLRDLRHVRDLLDQFDTLTLSQCLEPDHATVRRVLTLRFRGNLE